MRRLIAVLVSCIAVTALAAGMSEQAFTDTYVQQAKAAVADIEIKVVGPLHLQTKGEDGTETTIDLTNAYTQYTSNPENLQAIIGKFRRLKTSYLTGVSVLCLLATTADLADTSADLALCRDYNMPAERRLEACSKVIAHPMDAHAAFLAYANRAQTYFTASRGDKAFPDISKAISLEPDNAVGYLIRGGFNYSYFKYDDAIVDLSVALKKLPDDLGALEQRADSYGEVGKHELAITDYDAVIRLKPGDASVYYARAFEHQARRDFDRARADFERSFELDSQWAGDFPASCFDVEPWEKRRKLVNWPQCERDKK